MEEKKDNSKIDSIVSMKPGDSLTYDSDQPVGEIVLKLPIWQDVIILDETGELEAQTVKTEA